MSNTQRTDERCHDCLRPLDGQNCSAGGVHDLPTPTDDSVVEEPWTTTFLNAGTEMGLGDLSMMIGTVGKLLTSQSIKHKAEVEKARKEERERIRKFFKESSDDWSVNSDNWVKLDELLTNKES